MAGFGADNWAVEQFNNMPEVDPEAEGAQFQRDRALAHYQEFMQLDTKLAITTLAAAGIRCYNEAKRK